MKTGTDNFTEKNSTLVQEPRFVVALSFDDADTDITYLTSHSDAAVPGGTPSIDIIHDSIQSITGLSQKVVPDKAQHTIGNITVKAFDNDGALSTKIKTKLDGGESLRKKRIKVYVGFEGLVWADYAERLTYLVDSVEYLDQVYTFKTSDIQREARKTLFEPDQGVLTSTITATDTTIPLTTPGALTKFIPVAHDTIYSADSSETVGYAKIDDEVIKHYGVNAGGTAFEGVVRGALNTTAAAHTVTATDNDKKKKIEEYFYLEMAAPKMVYALLTGNLEGQAATLPDHWHLGISTTYVRLSDFQNIGSDLWDASTDKGRIARFIGLDKGEGKRFIEEDLLLWIGAFMPVYSDGALGIKRFHSVLPYSSYDAYLGVDDIVSYGALSYDMQSVINNISIKWNYIDSLERFTKINQLIDSNSISKHGKAPLKSLEFKGVFTGVHSDNDINNYFGQLRDRYASPPLRLKVQIMPEWNRLDVGDTIRLDIPHIIDYHIDDVLDRVFEVQQVTTDWVNGKVSLDLFGGVEPASQTALSVSDVLLDSYYTSAGTELSTVLTIVAGVVTVSGSLTGAALNTDGIYYYDGDLEIGAGVIVTCDLNVMVRIKGFFTINGDIIATGTASQVGYIGITQSGRAAWMSLSSLGVFVSARSQEAGLQGAVNEMPVWNLINENGSGIIGAPNNLMGIPGADGQDALENPLTVSTAPGGVGGAGGGGIVIVCRGATIGGAGSIDTSGGDGMQGTSDVFNTVTYYGQTGAGGNPGGVLFLIDGNYSTPTFLDSNTTAQNGDSPDPAGIDVYAPLHFYGIFYSGALVPNGDKAYGQTAPDIIDKSQSLIRAQYIPPPIEPFTWLPADEDAEASGQGYGDTRVPLDVSNFTASQNGGIVVFKWDTPLWDTGFEIRYGPRSNTNWEDASILTAGTKGTNVSSADVAPGDWSFFIKAKTIDGLFSDNALQKDLLVTNALDVVVERSEAPDWPGILTDFVKHWTGVLVPSSTSNNAALEWRVFDEYVPDPVVQAIYEGLEVDIGFDDDARVWGEITSALGMSEMGTSNPAFHLDYRTQAGSYDGFEPWSIGQLTLRYAKGKIIAATGDGVSYMQDLKLVVDQIEHIQKDSGVIISAGGTVIAYPNSFHTAPFVRVFAAGATALIATYELVTTTNFKMHLWNTSGVDVGGTGSWEAEGV